METKDLFLKFSRIYQSCTLLENLQAAYAMHDLSSCRELTAFYKKLTGDKKPMSFISGVTKTTENV